MCTESRASTFFEARPLPHLAQPCKLRALTTEHSLVELFCKRSEVFWRAEALVAARQREDPAMAKSIGTPANREAILAFREKRAADFSGM